MKKFIITTLTVIFLLSLLIPIASALTPTPQYTIQFPDYFEQTGDNEWYADQVIINNKVSTVLASVTFADSELTEEYVFSQSSLDISKQSSQTSQGFVKFYEEPVVELVSPNNYRCIYRAFVVNTDGTEHAVILYDFYSATQRCTVMFIASDPLFAHFEHFADPKIIDSIEFRDDFFTEAAEIVDNTIVTQPPETALETKSSSTGGLVIACLLGVSLLIAFIFALRGSLKKDKQPPVNTHPHIPAQPKEGTVEIINYTDISPEELIDDITFIKALKHTASDPWHQYDFLFEARGYGWEMMLDWADYMTEADLENISQVTTGTIAGNENDITESYIANGGKCKQTPELTTERGVLSVAGLSKTLHAPVKIVWVNQTRTLRLFTLINDTLLLAKYVETAVRRTFGTADSMKLGKPIPKETNTTAEPVTINGMDIHINSSAFINWKSKNPATPQYEFRSPIALQGKEPVISLYEDGTKTREYCLQTEGDENFHGKYFLVSVRLGVMGKPPVPTMQMDGFISDTPEEREITLSDIGYRMEGHYLACGGTLSTERYNAICGLDLPQKGLKYPGYTTPSNVRLVGICPECGKSFAFHGYAFYMIQNDVAYSDDGLYCCQISSYDEDIKTKVYEIEGKTFRYYNSFCCPHCNEPYIDYRKYPENKVFGVSGCVHLGTKHYTAQ